MFGYVPPDGHLTAEDKQRFPRLTAACAAA